MPRLVATDLDGTLLLPDGTVSARTRAALRACAAAGLPVVLATARPARVVRGLAAALGLSGPAVCLGGAQVVDLASGALVAEQRLPDAVAARVAAGLRAAVPDVLLVLEVGFDVHVEPGFALDSWGFAHIAEHVVERSLHPVGDGVTALLAGHPQRGLDELTRIAEEAAAGEATVTRSGGPHVEVFARGVTKASGLSRVCARLGVAAADVVAVGDEVNDLPMLAWAGRGVAVANAVPAVLRAADERVPANVDDGVAVLLEGLLAAG